MPVYIVAIIGVVLITCTAFIYNYIKKKSQDTGLSKEPAYTKKGVNEEHEKRESINKNINEKEKDKYGNIVLDNIEGFKEAKIDSVKTENGEEKVGNESKRVRVDETDDFVRQDFVIKRDEEE